MLRGQSMGFGKDVEMSKFDGEGAIMGSQRMTGFGLIVFIFSIAGVEMTIRWNGLVPQDDVSKPGQLVPLIMGMLCWRMGLCLLDEG